VSIREAIAAVAGGRSLTARETAATVDAMVEGAATAAQIGGFLMALHVKGETVDEICGAVHALRRHATPVRTPSGVVVDTCGTGGDARGTFNVSTAAALIVAAAGVRVAKHGNRAMTGAVGGADVLEALGLHLDVSPAVLERQLAEVGIAFLFAPRLHPAMARVAAVRRELGVRTIFNLAGPLANPAGVRRQVIGVFATRWIRPMAEALVRLGAEHAFVVAGRDGLDEITLTAATDVAEVRESTVCERVIEPEDLALPRCSLDALRVADTGAAAAVVRGILGGTPGPCRDVAVANAAAALYVAGASASVREGIPVAAEAIDSGRAQAVLERLVRSAAG
jgi:anthranilate phosphoribosyltransferase